MSEETVNAAPEATPEAEAPKKNAVEAVVEKIEQVENKVNGWVDKALNLVGDRPWEKWLGIANKYVEMILPLAIALAGVLACITGLVVAIKQDARFSQVIAQFWVLIPMLFALHLAPKALALARSFVEKGSAEPIRPELLYILKVVGGIGGVLLAVFGLLQFDKDSAIGALMLLFIAALTIIITTRPGIVGIKAAHPENVVEEVFAIVLLPVKIVLSLLTLFVGIGTVVGLVWGILTIFGVGIDNPYGIPGLAGMVAYDRLFNTSVLPLLLPLAVYLWTLFVLFIIDLLRAVAKIPSKLDEVKETIKK